MSRTPGVRGAKGSAVVQGTASPVLVLVLAWLRCASVLVRALSRLILIVMMSDTGPGCMNRNIFAIIIY